MSLPDKLKVVLAKAAGVKVDDVTLEVPPDPALGDYAFPCFTLAKSLKRSPEHIAGDVAVRLSSPLIVEAKALGSYVNIFVSLQALAEHLPDAREMLVRADKMETVCVESPSPNTNKPLHLGHARNMLLGNSVVTLLRRRGHKAIRLDLVNDRGVHICKSMLAYERWGQGETPSTSGLKGDHLCGKYYVVFAKEAEKDSTLEDQALEMLRKWEEGDIKILELWRTLRDWCLEGLAQTYKDFDVYIDKAHFESEVYNHGKEIVAEGLKKGTFFKDEQGAVCAREGEETKFLQRADGTSIYITQDIALAKKRFDEFHMDRMVYVVGNEQVHHFKWLFKLFKQLDFPFADKCLHLSYGMIDLPTGRMKSREGTIVDADDLRSEMIALASDEIRRRSPELHEDEVATRAVAVGMGALKFYVLKFDPLKDFTYNPEESISFAGDTGPYVQYTYARICSIFRKAGAEITGGDVELLSEPLERQMLAKLLHYPEVLVHAADNYRPSEIAQYLLELSRLANSYYHDVLVLVDDVSVRYARLWLLHKVRETLKDGLAVLGIDVLEEM